jgi:hypothetical protein
MNLHSYIEAYIASGGVIKRYPKGYHSEYGFFWGCDEPEIANDITSRGLFEIGLKNEYNQ